LAARVTSTARSTSVAEARDRAAVLVATARREALADRAASLEELSERQAALEANAGLLADRERDLRELKIRFDEHRHSLGERRAVVDADRAVLADQLTRTVELIAERAGMDSDTAAQVVLERTDAELAAEHPDRVARQLESGVADAAEEARRRLTEAIERQDGSHADSAPRATPVSLEDLDEARREAVLTSLAVIAEETSTELSVDDERQQASLRGLDPVGRELARQAGIEVIERRLQVADVHPFLIDSRRSLSSRIAEIGERAMWEMRLEGRPELAEMVGTLHYRFSYGQNALLHCKEAGYLCGVLAAELGMEFSEARRAGMLHDVGKSVDHDVEGSHAVIGADLLDIFGTPRDLTHAVRAHHFDVEPSSDLALLTICADAISASRPGARRDTLTTYLARLEQLQEIATRHRGVERAFPLQAGREVRISVKPRSIGDAQLPELCHEIAREIESEMQFPGMIKVVVIRTTTASATSGPDPQASARGGTGRSRSKRRRSRGGGGPKGPHADAAGQPVDSEPVRAEATPGS